MSEKIAFASWDFFELVCDKHRKPLELKLRRSTPVYACIHPECSLYIPTVVYEKIRDEVIKKTNESILTLGDAWRKKYSGKTYEIRVISFADGKKTVVSVKCLE